MRALHWIQQAPRTRLLGWVVVLIGVLLILDQGRIVVQKKTALPDIRHFVYWTKNLYQQASRNRSAAISTNLASFYLIERELRGRELLIEPRFEAYRWNLEHVSHARVTQASIRSVRAEAWSDLAKAAPRKTKLEKRALFVFPESDVQTYVFVSTTDDSTFYIVPERVYRARSADKSGANLSAP